MLAPLYVPIIPPMPVHPATIYSYGCPADSSSGLSDVLSDIGAVAGIVLASAAITFAFVVFLDWIEPDYGKPTLVQCLTTRLRWAGGLLRRIW
jgi:hypothetical protein